MLRHEAGQSNNPERETPCAYHWKFQGQKYSPSQDLNMAFHQVELALETNICYFVSIWPLKKIPTTHLPGDQRLLWCSQYSMFRADGASEEEHDGRLIQVIKKL